MSDFKRDRLRKIERFKAATPGKEALEVLLEVRRDYDWAIDGYRNSLSILSDTSYKDRRHFLLELIQNADDAQFDDGAAQLCFEIFDQGLALSYNERGFTSDDVMAITDTGSSNKRGKELSSHRFIGEKGIGFKSVFALADYVDIHSPPWHFRLTKDECILPKALPAESLGKNSGTRIFVAFSDTQTTRIVADELHRLLREQMESFLFLQRISKFVFEDRRNGRHERDVIDISPSMRNSDKLAVSSSSHRRENGYAVFSKEYEFGAHLAQKRWEKDIGALSRKFSVAIELSGPVEKSGSGLLFCYLPTEEKLPVPMFLQVDAQTTADRGRLLQPDELLHPWNAKVFDLLPGFLSEAILHWRNDNEVRDRIPSIVPIASGDGQLAPVFQKLMFLCRTTAWIRVMADEQAQWASPRECVRLTPFWEQYFTRYPQERRKAQAASGLLFVHPHWSSGWAEHWRFFGVQRLSATTLASFLPSMKFSKEFRSERASLAALYEDVRDKIDQAPRSERDQLIDATRKAMIFPFRVDDNSFTVQPIDKTKRREAYWLGTRSLRDTGLEQVADLAIIHPNYTKPITVKETDPPEKQHDQEMLARRNTALKTLLQRIGAKELNDDNLTQLQVDFVLMKKGHGVTKQSVLRSMYEVFTAKKEHGEEYVGQLRRLSNAEFLGSNTGEYHLCHKLTLPQELIQDGHASLYFSVGLDQIDMSKAYSETSWMYKLTARDKSNWRSFLHKCGVVSGPSLRTSRTDYTDTADFRSVDRSRFTAWKDRILGDYTSSNFVRVAAISFDPVTLRLSRGEGLDNVEFWEQLYQCWVAEHAANASLLNDMHYPREKPSPGFFQALYMRKGDTKSPLVRDGDWAGIPRGEMRLKTIDGRLERAQVCYYADAPVNRRGAATGHLAIVLAGNGEGAYSKYFLTSLDVKPITADHVSRLSADHKNISKQFIAAIALELAQAGVSMENLLLHDEESDALRSVRDFHLGDGRQSGVPMIEAQYGESGRRLGELLQLSRMDDSAKFKRVFEAVISKPGEPTADTELASLLGAWLTMSAEEREDCRAAFDEVVAELCPSGKKPLLIINEAKLALSLFMAGEVVCCVEVPPDAAAMIRQTARECGFTLPTETGEIQAVGATSLSAEESCAFDELFRLYMQDLNESERVSLNSLLDSVGGMKGLATRVSRVGAVYRVFGKDIRISVEPPLIDSDRRNIYIAASANAAEAVAGLLIALKFTTAKSAKRELRDMADALRRGNKARTLVSRENEVPESSQDEAGQDVVSPIATSLEESYVDNRPAQASSGESQWNLGLSPNEEQEFISVMGEQMVRSLSKGQRAYEQSIRMDRSIPQPKVNALAALVDPKEFLLAEYDGRCQICATELPLSSGGKWVETFRIVQTKESKWWANEPFNVLGLCPNCHALARHGGGRDLSALRELVHDILGYSVAPREVTSHSGDFYVTYVKINGFDQQLVMSAVHMGYLVALYKAEQAGR